MKNNEMGVKPQKEMSKKARRALIIATAIILLVAIACVTVAVVVSINANKVKDPVLEYEGARLPLSFYSLMLSKTKGNLAKNGNNVNSISFWDSESSVAGKTNAEYYTERTMENCRLYLLSVYLFDKEGLELPESYLESIEEEIRDCIDIGYIGGGSEEKFNQILAPYGLDIDSYREALIIKGKAEYLQEYLFGSGGSKISEELKDEYYEMYYHRFKQIFVAKYYYEYEIDDFGSEIYFSGDSATPIYDTENGAVAFDESGKYLRDKYGEKIYFEKNAEGDPILDKPLYDKENGERQPVRDENGLPIKHYYTDAENAERYARAQSIVSSVNQGNFAAFEAQMEEFDDAVAGADENPDGYYLSSVTGNGYYGYDYLNDILARLENMNVGDREIVESDEGYHIVMKYALDDGAYSDDKKSAWFDNFVSTIMTDIFKTRYKDIIEGITVNKENLAKAESIKFIGVNYNYWQ